MRRLAVFARWPAPGAVKRRLSPALPSSLACALHEAMLGDVLSTAAQAGAGELILYWADRPAGERSIGTPVGLEVRDQEGADLGSRLARAFAELLSSPDDRAVAIGTDCPELPAEAIGEAFQALDTTDLVLAPAADGGYVLIGLRRAVPALFEGIAWGGDQVMEQTLARARRAGLEPALLDGYADLDTPEDLARFVARHAFAGGAAAPRTRAALREMGLLPPPA
jgi:rSAM/selenodomain-associated transferase 1